MRINSALDRVSVDSVQSMLPITEARVCDRQPRVYMHQHRDAQLVGTSVAIRTVLEDVGYAASTDAKVLITGESGVGKEIVAHRLHGTSRRAVLRRPAVP